MAEEDAALFFTGLGAPGDPVRAIGVQVSAGARRWVTLGLATQEWRWMFYREKYDTPDAPSQRSLFP
jgi:hypothetical protein